jgi:hypothetical protein
MIVVYAGNESFPMTGDIEVVSVMDAMSLFASF